MALSIAKPVTVADVMTPSVYTLDQDDTLKEAATMLTSARVSGAPVVDPSGRLVGMLTETDILRAFERESDKAEVVPEEGYAYILRVVGFREVAPKILGSLGRLKVKEAMSRPVVTTMRTTALDQVAREMDERRVNRLPVVEEDRIVGIVSRADIVKALARFHEAGSK